MTLKILHTADWHIGSFPGPEINGENARYLDICNCLKALTEAAERERPDIAVVSGDIFHQARVWSDRGLKESQTAITTIRALSNVCPVVVLRGTPNHDSEQQFEMLKTAFTGDDSVHIATEPELVSIDTYSGQPVQVACIPCFDRGEYRAKHPGLSREEETQAFTDALASIVIGLKAQCEAGTPTILSTHFTVPGCNMESGQTALFAQYDPVIYPDTLLAANYDLVALGHIHRPQLVPDAGNTYYCGSLTGLNFNDEGRKRGFYIHELSDGDIDVARKWTETAARFIETPYREFKTVELDDEDIEKINIDGPGWLYSSPNTQPIIQDKIVRVLYKCTDEHNKAFNHATLQDHLKDLGAFWVQEITPQEIAVSVNREEMEGDNSPESNLAAYLESKEIPADDAARIIELARPIISETVEKSKADAPTGVFLPLEIEVHNYRNYRDERFSYDGVTFATINGENGAGKSSLFMDAILDALYEEPREGDLTGWICNAPEVRSGYIKFTFRLGDKTYRVTRTRQKSGKATLNLSELLDGEWQDRSAERYRDTQAIIQQTVGMDSLTLKATGLIMQDQYAIFLQADKTDRMAILGNILGLGIYDSMESVAADRATNANRELHSIKASEEELTRSMPDRDTVVAAMDKAAADRAAAEAELKQFKADADNIRFRTRIASEAALRAKKIAEEINTLAEKKRACANAQMALNAVITAADATIAQTDSIKAGVEEYNALAEREKTMLGDIALYEVKQAEAADLDIQIGAQRIKKSKLESARSAAEASCWSYEQALAGTAALEEKAARYDEAQDKLNQLEEQNDDYANMSLVVTDALHELNALKVKLEGTQKQGDARINALKAKAAMLESSGCTAANPQCRFLADAVAARDSIPAEEAALAEQISSLTGRIEAQTKYFNDMAAKAKALKCDAELAAQRATVAELQKAKDDLAALGVQKARYDALKAKIADYGTEIDALAQSIEQLESRKAPVMEEVARIAAVKEEYAVLSARLQTAKVWLEKEKQLPAAIERKSSAQARLAELRTEEAETNSQILLKDAEREKEATDAQDAAALELQLDGIAGRIELKERVIKQLDEEAGRYRRQLEEVENAEARLDELREQAQRQGQRAADYEELKRAFSQDGIPHNIVRSIVPLFEATASNILGQMSGGRMAVEMRMEKTLKSNSKKEVTALDIIVNDADTGALPYMSRSGGERVKASLSVVLALSEIKQSQSGTQLGFLFIDEPAYLDDRGVQAYCDALEAIQRRYPNMKIMAITHDPEMKARFPQAIDVVKTAEGSKVIYG